MVDKVTEAAVVGGVDTHKDLHVAAVVDQNNKVLGTQYFSTTRQGYRQMLAWMTSFGTLKRIGVECTGTYGSGLLRYFQNAGLEVGFAPIFPDTCYHLTHYWPAAADIPVASDNPAHYADAIRYNARTPLQGSLLPLTRLVWA